VDAASKEVDLSGVWWVLPKPNHHWRFISESDEHGDGWIMILGNFDLDYDDADLLLRKLEAFFPIVF
jgi:hypothetical protein